MHKYTPPKINRPLFLINIFTLLAAGAMFFCAVIFSPSRLFEIGGTAFLILFVQMTVRYLLTSYTYIIEGNDLIIVKTRGKRSVRAGSLDLSSGVNLYSKTEFEKIKKEKLKTVTVVYNYCQNIFPKNSYYYIFEFNGTLKMLVFEPDEKMISLIGFLLNSKTEE